MSEASKIEIAKALKAVKSVSSSSQLQQIIDMFSSNKKEKEYFNRAINGLSEEDEFSLLTKLMQTSTCIIGLEQRPIIEGNYVIPDFLVSFKPGCTINGKLNAEFNEYNCLVEVKSTKKDKFKIGGNRLQKLRNTADKYKLPLIFAIRFMGLKEHAVWAFIEDNRNNTSINSSYGDCLDGIRHILWDEYYIMLDPSLKVSMEFHANSNKNAMSHKVYGRQEKLILHTASNEMVVEDVSPQLFYSVFLECFNLETKSIEKVNDNITIHNLQPEIEMMLLSDIVYRINRIAKKEDGSSYYDASKILANLDGNKTFGLVTRSNLEQMFSELLLAGVILPPLSIKGQDKHLDRWKEFGKVI